MVEIDYINLDDAKQVARAWLFENANEFFRLGLSEKRRPRGASRAKGRPRGARAN